VPRSSESTLAAIKRAVDIVDLAGDYLTLHRVGSKFKALCPFHDDHNPSLELNSERQSFRCWACGAGGDIFDFVMDIEKVEFPEALRMLAERAGIALETGGEQSAKPSGASKTELLAVLDWAAGEFARALAESAEGRAYVASRGIAPASVERFGLGLAPDVRDWLTILARKRGHSVRLLEEAGLVGRSSDHPQVVRERFRGRLIFPIRDIRGRTVAFGGRILPATEKRMADAGLGVAKYLNSPETLLFQKRRHLYAADLARAEARRAGWVGVVEGYTDVIAAHQVGLTNVVGTLGTALSEDHAASLRRLADRVVLVFDGDEAGRRAADRALEIFLGHELDVRVLSLPNGLDPADFLAERGGDEFRRLLERAVDPMVFLVERARDQFDLDSTEGARQAAEHILGILAKMPRLNRTGIDVKVGQALNNLSRLLRLPVQDRTLTNRLRQLLKSRVERRIPVGKVSLDSRPTPTAETPPIRPTDLDPTDRWLIELLLGDPTLVSRLITQVTVAMLRDAPLRAILQACYDLHAEGQVATFDRVVLRLDDPAVKALAAALAAPAIDPAPLPDDVRPAPPASRLAGVLARLAERNRQQRLRDLKTSLDEIDPTSDPEHHQALRQEYFRLLHQWPDPRKIAAS
jgi:DNA primase